MVLGRRSPRRNCRFPVAHIHGTHDRILPPRYTEADGLLPGAVHCLPLTRPDDINAFVKRSIEKYP